MRAIIPMVLVMGMLSACTFGGPQPDTYTDKNGDTTVIRSDRELCVHSCNEDYNRCMDMNSSQDSPVNGPAGMFGTGADCRSALKDCLPGCKSR